MLLTQVFILVHHTKVAVFYEKTCQLQHLKVLASYLVWNILVPNIDTYIIRNIFCATHWHILACIAAYILKKL